MNVKDFEGREKELLAEDVAEFVFELVPRLAGDNEEGIVSVNRLRSFRLSVLFAEALSVLSVFAGPSEKMLFLG